MPKDVLEKSILPPFRSAASANRKRSRAACVFLASDDAGLITGATLTANGGQYITLTA